VIRQQAALVAGEDELLIRARKMPPEVFCKLLIRIAGWVVRSLEASLWVFQYADSFEEAVLRAVNLGDDADTTGTICGQLAGAHSSESQIPGSLRSGLARMDMIEEALEEILLAARKSLRPAGQGVYSTLIGNSVRRG
jgi:hypothetical protein